MGNAKVILILVTPRVVNYVFTEDGKQISVADLDEATLRQIGADWTEKLVEHARKRQPQPT